jgi:3',5'-cyclic AMP phosphodiesterase CpdA
MKIVAHISDLHFGTEDPVVAEGLFAQLSGQDGPAPTLVAVSGDLTQRATREQFRAAKAYLDRLPCPYLVIPGNHDIPMFNAYQRFVHPLRRYCEEISDNLAPLYVDEELAVVGVTTAHGFTIKDGKMTAEKIANVREELSGLKDRWRIVVAHHPFVIPEGGDKHDLVDGVEEAVTAFHEIGVDLVLGGHLHVAYSADLAGFRDMGREMIAVAAGTCMSTRTRGEPNAYNVLRFEANDVAIVNRVWDGTTFVAGAAKVYRSQGKAIVKLEEATAPAVLAAAANLPTSGGQ